MVNIHASCVKLNGVGVLVFGKSGSGKSDLAFRLIKTLGATLIADDRTEIILKNHKIIASCPQKIQGLLEVRGVGIIKLSFEQETSVGLVVELVDDTNKIERHPEPVFWEFEKVKIRKIYLYPFEESAIYKLQLACDENLQVY